MPNRGGKQGGSGNRGGRGGRGRGRGRGRGGQFRGQSGGGGGYSGGGNGGGGSAYGIDYYNDHEDDYISFVGRNHQQKQRSTEEDVYRRIQQAKAGRGGSNGPGQFRPPPPPPKQGAKGKNSKHAFWPRSDHHNNNDINNRNSGYTNSGQFSSSSNARRGGNARSVAFNRATVLTDPTALNDQGEEDEEDDEDMNECSCDGSDVDTSDDLIDRGIDDDDESDEEFLMQQFNWFEEDQDQLGSSSQMNSTPRSSGKQKQKHIQTPKQQPEPQQQTSQNEQIAAVELITKIIAPLSISCLDTAMTQSEDFMQAMEAEGDIKVHADEIEELSRPLSALSSTSRGSIHKIKKAKVVEVTSSSTTIHVSQDGTLMESQAEMTTTLVSASNDSSQSTAASAMGADLQSTTAEAAAPMKPKKKAHRSKRGGIKQRERQTNRQMAVGHDDDGLMFLEEPSDDDEDEDMLAMQDYLQNTGDHSSLDQLESLLGALKGLHAGGQGHSKNAGGLRPDDSDYEQQASEIDSEDQDDEDEDDFDFEEDYEDGFRKLDFSKVSASANDKRKNRPSDDLLREELRDLMPLWRSGALQDGDGANRRFKSRARGYDLYDSDDGFMVASSAGGKGGKKNKNKKEPHGGSFETLMDINRQIENFVQDRSSDNLQLPPMPKPLRRKIHLLCNHYNLKSQSVGSGKRRFPILIKTDRTKMPINPVNVSKLLNQSEKELKELTKLSAQFQGSRRGGNNGSGSGNNGGGWNGKGKGKGRSGNGGGFTVAMHGTVVGASASAISVENVGHRMLSKMGWCPGVGLGATGEGITQPIEAIVRAKHRGLGHE